MSNYPVGRRPRSADPHSTLRLAALTAVIVGVVLLAAAAFVLSYSGIHQVALQAGVSPRLAKLYPVIFDAMLVIAGAAAMALRGAGWWTPLLRLGLPDRAARGRGHRGRRARHGHGPAGAGLPRRRGGHPVGAPAARVRPAAGRCSGTSARPGPRWRPGRRPGPPRSAAAAGEANGTAAGADDGDLGRGTAGAGTAAAAEGTAAAPAPVQPGHAAGTQDGPAPGHRGAPTKPTPWTPMPASRRPGELRRGDGLRPPGQLPGRGRILAARRFRRAGGATPRTGPATCGHADGTAATRPGTSTAERGRVRRAGTTPGRAAERAGRRAGAAGRGPGSRATAQPQSDAGGHGRGHGGSGPRPRATAERRPGQAEPRRETIRPAEPPVTTPAARRRRRGARGWSGCGAPRAGPRSNHAAAPDRLRRASPVPSRPRRCPHRGRSGPGRPWWSRTR